MRIFAVAKNFLLLVCLTGCTTVALSGCSKPNQNTNEGEVMAPGGAYTAVVFHRNADALRTATENVSIVRFGEPVLNDIGNVYCASREQAVGEQKLWLYWRNNETLQIFRNPATHSYKEEKHFDCMTGIFVQTTPFQIEFGDIKDIHPDAKVESKPQPAVKRKRQK